MVQFVQALKNAWSHGAPVEEAVTAGPPRRTPWALSG